MRRYASEPTLRTYAKFVRRHIVLLVACLVAGGVVTGIKEAASPLTYRSTAMVVVSIVPATSADEGLQLGRRRNVSVDSDAQVVRSTRVLRRAAEVSEFVGGYEELDRNLDITALPNSRVLKLRVSSTQATLSRDAAAAVAETFLDVRRAAIERVEEEERTALEGEIEEVGARLAALLTQSQRVGAATALELEEGRLTDRLEELELQLAQQIATPIDPGFVAEPPRASSGVHENVPGQVITGALCGLAIGLAIAIARGSSRPGGGPARSSWLRRLRRVPATSAAMSTGPRKATT